jgi:hypothetical protein
MFYLEDTVRCQIYEYEISSEGWIPDDVEDPIGYNNFLQIGARTDLLNDPLWINTTIPMTDGR